MRFSTSIKFMAVVTLLSCLTYWAGNFHDAHFHSTAFMDSPTGLELDWNDLSQRDVASDLGEFEGVHFPFNKSNAEKVYGVWQIFKYVDVNGTEEDFEAKVRFTLIADATIRIGDTDQVFIIGHIYEDGVHRLFKKIEGGIEQIFARKIHVTADGSPSGAGVAAGNISASAPVKKKGLINFEDADLVLDKVYNPNMSKLVVTGELVTGNVNIVGGSIQNFEAMIQYSAEKTQEIKIDFADINDGGQFDYEYEKDGSLEIGQGLITNNGKGAYKIRFATGPYQGAYLNFLTYEAWEENQYQKELAKEKAEVEGTSERMDASNRMVKEKLDDQNRAAEERRREAIVTGEETVDTVTPEEMAERLKNTGFAFGGAPKSMSRSIASRQK